MTFVTVVVITSSFGGALSIVFSGEGLVLAENSCVDLANRGVSSVEEDSVVLEAGEGSCDLCGESWEYGDSVLRDKDDV